MQRMQSVFTRVVKVAGCRDGVGAVTRLCSAAVTGPLDEQRMQPVLTGVVKVALATDIMSELYLLENNYYISLASS